MYVRDATPSDAEAIRAVHRRSIEALGTQAYSHRQVEAWAAGCESADYTSAIEDDETEFVVAVVDGAVTGFGTVKPGPSDGYDPPVDAEVTAVYVHPSVARRGVGTSICSELEERARATGVQTLGLTASRNAVPFYEARGYERVGERTHEFSTHEGTGVTGVVVEMQKTL